VGAKCSLKFLQCDLLPHLVENKWFCSLEDLGDEERRSPVTFLRNAQPLKMELTQGSETSANYNLTPGKYPKEHIQYSNHGQSLKSAGICGFCNVNICT